MFDFLSKDIKSVLVFGIGMGILAFIFSNQYIALCGLSISILAIVSSQFRQIFLKLWFGFAHVLGKINGAILLTIVFFLLVTPLAILFRVLKRETKFIRNKQTKSYYENREHLFIKEDLETPF
jgi:hypothetical protein